MPLVSVIIPNYNHARFLKERIDSIINQTFSDFELILLDDASTDDSKTILESYRDNSKLAKLIINSQNSGNTFRQWDLGIKTAQGEYILLAESDDVAHPQLLEKLVEKFREDPQLVLAYTQSNRMNAEGELTGSWLTHTKDLEFSEKWENDYINDGLSEIKSSLIFKNTIPNASAVLFKKEAYFQCGGVDLEVLKCGDWFLWIKLLLTGKIAFIATPLNNFRYHSGSVIATSAMIRDYYDTIMRAKLNDHFRQIGVDKSIIDLNNKFLRSDLSSLAKWYFRKGKFWQSLSTTLRLLRFLTH
ncbi:MAG: glycosyltransferase family 2 protein [Nodosilinea sp.]